MTPNPFEELPFIEQNFVQRLLNVPIAENAIIELNNILATKPVQDISSITLGLINRKYKINLIKKFKTKLIDLYLTYLKACLTDKSITDEEQNNLNHLELLFEIDKTTAKELYNHSAIQIYSKSLEFFIAKGEITDKDKFALEKIQSNLRIEDSKIFAISEKYKETFLKNFIHRLSISYELIPENISQLHLISDKFNAERNALEKLNQIFLFDEIVINRLFNEFASDLYKKVATLVISKGHISDDDKIYIEKFRQSVDLPEIIADDLLKECKINYVKTYIDEIIANQRYSPEQENQLHEFETNFQVKIKLNANIKKTLAKCRHYWQIENDQLLKIETGFDLFKNENCYFSASAKWFELTKRDFINNTSKSNLTDFSGNLPNFNHSQSCLLEEGTLYLTDRRLIFRKKNKNKIILLKNIPEFQIYKDGVWIKEIKGRQTFLEIVQEFDDFILIFMKQKKSALS